MTEEMDILVRLKDQASSGFKKIGNNLREVDYEASRATKGMQNLYSSIVSIGSAIAGGAFLKGAITTFATFDDNMRAAGAVTNATSQEMEKMTALAEKMGKETSFSAAQSAEALKFMGMAGMSAKDAMTALPDVINLAAAGALDLGTATDIATNILSGFGLEAEKLHQVNNVLAKTFTSANVTLTEMGGAFKEVGSFAKGVGGDFEELNAAIGMLGNAGIKGTQAGTSLKNAIRALLVPTGDGAKMFEELSQRIGGAGLQVQDSEGNFIGFANVLDQLQKAGITGTEMIRLFGMEAGPGMTALLNQGTDKLKDLTNELKNVGEEAQTLADKMNAGLGGELRRTESALEAVFLAFGKALSPEIIVFLQNLQDKFGEIVNTVNALAQDGNFAGWGTRASQTLDAVTWAAEKTWNGLRAIIAANSALVLASIGDTDAAKIALQDFVDNTNKMFGTYKENTQGAVVVTKAITQEMLNTRESAKNLGAIGTGAQEAKTKMEEFRQVVVGFRQDGTAITVMEKSVKNVSTGIAAGTKEIKDFEKEATKAYNAAQEEAEKYAKQVVDLDEKIKNSKIETQDTIRELNRKGMTEEQDWLDRQLEAEEKLSEAKKALAQGDFELAETLAKESKSLFTGLAQDVKDNQGNVTKSIDETKKIATKGVQDVGDFSVKMYEQQKKNADASLKSWQTAMANIKTELDKITKDREAKVKVTLSQIAEAEARIKQLTKPETKTIYVKTVETNKTGGPIYGFSEGQYIPRDGKLPGYGGGDKIRALLEPGEFILRKEAVRAIGLPSLFDLNALRFNIGGAVPDFPQQDIPDMSSNGPGETLTLKFQTADTEASVNVTDVNSQMSLRAFAKLLQKSRLSYVK